MLCSHQRIHHTVSQKCWVLLTETLQEKHHHKLLKQRIQQIARPANSSCIAAYTLSGFNRHIFEQIELQGTSKEMSSSSQDVFRRRRKGIPAFVFVPLNPPEAETEDDDSLSEPLERSGFVGQRIEESTMIRTPSIKLRTQSLPTTLAAAYKTISLQCSDSRLPPLTLSRTDDSTDGDSHVDRPPRVPQRRGSLQTCNSCPMMTPASRPAMMTVPMPYHRPGNAVVRRALAA